MKIIKSTSQFKKSVRKILKSGICNGNKIEKVINLLASDGPLPYHFKDHPLKGVFSGYRECHIKPDLLLIYKLEDNNLILILVDIGSHSNLFR